MSIPRRIRSRIVEDNVAPSRVGIDGIKISYRLRPGSGAPGTHTVLVLHGFTGQGADWAAVCDQLAAAGHGTICPDHPGHGGSDAPDDPAHYSMERLADMHAALCAHLDCTPVVVVGHSMGGAAAEQFAIRHRRAVSGLVLVDSIGGRRKTSWSRVLAKYATPELRTIAFDQGMGALYDHQVAQGSRSLEHIPEALRPDIRAHFAATSATGYFHAAAGMRDRVDTLDALADFDGPALVMTGADEDPTFIEASRELDGCLADSRFRFIEDAAHNPQFEAPDRMAELLLEFLAGLADTLTA